MEHQPHHHQANQSHDCHATPVGADSHNQHAGHSVASFRDKFWWSLILTIPVVLYSPMVQAWLGFSMPTFPGSSWLPLVLGSWLFFYGGSVFIKGAKNELVSRRPGMMTLIALAIVAAYIYSVATVIWLPGVEFFWELSTLITIMLLGHWIEMKSIQSASGALQELSKLLPDTAELVQGGVVPVGDLKVGDIMLIRPGAKMPADGEVTDGHSSVDESMITGESRLVDKVIGNQIIAGTINGNGVLQVRVTKLGEQTALAGIMRLVAEAQRSRSRAQVLADRAAFYLTVIAVAVGTGTLGGWLVLGETTAFALERMVTVFIIACPHALGLAVPLVTSISTTLAAKNGLLIRRRLALESARRIDVVLFDKTGTLTQGRLGVADIWPIEGQTSSTVLTIAASVERDSEHPLARAIVDRATAEKSKLLAVTDFKYHPGLGVEGNVEGKLVAVGGAQLLQSKHIPTPASIAPQIKQAEADGKSIIWVMQTNQVIGAVALTDLIREESREAVRQLQVMNIKVAMLTGDSSAVASHVARELGIKDYFAQILPEHKVDKVKQLQADGSRVAMVGDGVNDAPALTQADIGIAIGAGTDVAIESAGVILMKSDPRDIVKIIRLSRATYGKMVQNLIWATSYNIIAIPLATGFLGIILPAALGAVLMSISTIVVAINAQLLRKLRLS